MSDDIDKSCANYNLYSVFAVVLYCLLCISVRNESIISFVNWCHYHASITVLSLSLRIAKIGMLRIRNLPRGPTLDLKRCSNKVRRCENTVSERTPFGPHRTPVGSSAARRAAAKRAFWGHKTLIFASDFDIVQGACAAESGRTTVLTEAGAAVDKVRWLGLGLGWLKVNSDRSIGH